MGKKKRPIPASVLLGNIYEVYTQDRKTLLRKVQIVAYNHPNITLNLVEKFNNIGNFYPKVSVQATRQPTWKLIEANAPIPSDEPELPLKNNSDFRMPKLDSGKTIDDVRKGDIWLAKGTNTGNENGTARLKVSEVTSTHVYLNTLKRTGNIRTYSSVTREAFRDGRYSLLERDPDAPLIPRSPRNHKSEPDTDIITHTKVIEPERIEEPPKQQEIVIDPILKCRVPLEMIMMIERDRANGRLCDRYSHMTYRGNVIIANKIVVPETGNTVFEFEWNPED